jgi:hypothetical protein
MKMNSQKSQWIESLNEEDLHFLKRFTLLSGSLKALAKEYGVTYPTIRNRLDKLINKIESIDNTQNVDLFHQQLKLLLIDGLITPEAAKQLLSSHNKVINETKMEKES